MKRKLIGTEVNIDGKEGEITNVLGNGYEIVFFDTNLGKTYIDNRDIVNYIVNMPDEWIKTDDYQYVRPSAYRKWQIVEARYTESDGKPRIIIIQLTVLILSILIMVP